MRQDSLDYHEQEFWQEVAEASPKLVRHFAVFMAGVTIFFLLIEHGAADPVTRRLSLLLRGASLPVVIVAYGVAWRRAAWIRQSYQVIIPFLALLWIIPQIIMSQQLGAPTYFIGVMVVEMFLVVLSPLRLRMIASTLLLNRLLLIGTAYVFRLREITWGQLLFEEGHIRVFLTMIGLLVGYQFMMRYRQNDFSRRKTLTRLNEELQVKNDLINAQHAQMLSSLEYARTIQRVLLPIETTLDGHFPEHLVLYEPRDIVSGDFYWFSDQHKEFLFLAVADCTGHGVPGALLTMVGAMLLHKIVHETGETLPSLILARLHQEVRRVLRQETTRTDNPQDGMDIGFCRFDRRKTMLTFAGARLPLYVVRAAQVTVVKGDHKGLGGLQKETQRQFTDHTLSVQSGDAIYLTTDGVIDLPNPQGKRFGSARWESLLASLAALDCAAQHQTIVTTLRQHQQNQPPWDDLTVLGVKL